MSPRLVVFTGPAGCGKSTAASYLVREYGFTRLRFAGPLKDMLHAIGLSEIETDGALKETPCELLGGKTPRHAMQTLGTEWGRDLIDGDFWVNLWARRADILLSKGVDVVCDDCRFPNEAKAAHQLGGLIVKIYGAAGVAADSGHASEHQDIPSDFRLFNDGLNHEVFEARLDGVLERMEMHYGGGRL